MTLFGLSPLDGLTAVEVGTLVAVYAASFLVKGVFGYGAVPLLIVAGSQVVDPHHAVVLAALTNLMTHAAYMPDGIVNGRRDLTGSLAVFLLPSIAVGVWIFAALDGNSLSVLAGIIILGSIIADARNLLAPLAPWVKENTRVATPVFGVAAGLISGLVGAGSVAFISLYVRIFAADRRTFRATLILLTAVILVWRSTILALTGQATLTIALEALLLLPGGLLAGYLGSRISKRLTDENFFRAYRLVLGFGAVLMILRGAVGF